MKKIILPLILIFVLSSLSFGQTKEEKVEQLVKDMGIIKSIDKAFDQITEIMKKHAMSKLSAENQNEYMDFVKSETEALTKKLINREIVPIYSKYYTEEEISGLIEFYNSDLGKKTMEVMPEIQNELMEIVLSGYIADFRQIIDDKLIELNKKGIEGGGKDKDIQNDEEEIEED
jgi:hypothetical protein